MSHTFIRTSISILLGLTIAFSPVSLAHAADGSLDPNFGNGGIVTTDIGENDDLGLDVAVQPDGRILVAGTSSNVDATDSGFGLVRYNPDGSLDTTFDADGKVTTSFGTGYDLASAIALQEDGRIIAAGHAHTGADVAFALARYHPDGSLDTTFDLDGKVTTSVSPYDDYGEDIVLQPDGKILMTGLISSPVNINGFVLVRYNSDGSLDDTFGDGGMATSNFNCVVWGQAVILQPDGKIVTAGSTCGPGGTGGSDFALARFNSDGSPDTTFDQDGIVTLDFGDSQDTANAVAVQPDGGIVLAGHSYTDPNVTVDFALARFHSDGSPDSSFDQDGKVTTDLGGWRDMGNALTLQADGRILVAGEQWQQEGGTVDFALARYNADGSLDPAFDTDGIAITDISSGDYAAGLTLQADGQILVAGWSDNGIHFDFTLARYDAAGTAIEATLDVRPGKFPNRIELEKNICKGKDDDNLPVAILTTPEFDALQLVDATSLQIGDPALGGTAAPIHSQARDIDHDGDRDVGLLFALCDLVANHALDENSTELVLTGRTLDGGTFTARDAVQMIGHRPPTTVVPSFIYPVDGQVLDYEGSYLFKVKPVPGAQGYLWGFFQNGEMVWENFRDEGVLSGDEYGIHPGTLANSRFVPGPVEVWVRASINGQWTDAAVITIHLQSTGDPLDPTFGSGGRVTTPFGNDDDPGFAVAVQPDGKILMAGTDWESRINGTPIGHVNFALARYNSNGSLDTSFGVDGQVSTDFNNDDDFGADVAVQPDGKILMTGQTFLLHSGYLLGLARYNSDGTLDNTFDTDGKVTTAFGFGEDYGGDIALQPDGKIIVAGSSEQGGHWDIALARYNSDGSLDATFDADGKVLTDFGGRRDFGVAVALQPDGKIVVAGRSESGNNVDFALARYNNDGTLDKTFAGSGLVLIDFAKGDFGYAVALQPDGKILLAGAILINDGGDFALVRYNSDGSLDTSFDSDGIVTTDLSTEDAAHEVLLQPDGKMILAGARLGMNDPAPMDGIIKGGGGDSGHDFALARYNSDGSLDVTFDSDGIIQTDFSNGDDSGQAAALQPDGKIILAGYSHNGIDYDFALARYQIGVAVQEVAIDIKPGSKTNHVNPNSRGRISVAILSTPEFDAYAMTDGTSLTFGRTGDENSLLECKGKSRDVNHDGLRDLICTFSIQAARFQKGDITGILRGQTLNGISITGSDSVLVGRESDDS